MASCRLYTYETHRRGGFGERIQITRCLIDSHVCGCVGEIKDCDKDPRPCPHAVMQGPEPFCKEVREVRECKGDIDFCDLVDCEQKRISYVSNH